MWVVFLLPDRAVLRRDRLSVLAGRGVLPHPAQELRPRRQQGVPRGARIAPPAVRPRVMLQAAAVEDSAQALLRVVAAMLPVAVVAVAEVTIEADGSISRPFCGFACCEDKS